MTDATLFDAKTPDRGGMMVVEPPLTVIDLVERALKDPTLDVDKLERVIALAKDMKAVEAAKAFSEAMNAAQDGMNAVRTDKANTGVQGGARYATFVALDKALRPIYTKHGFSLSFDTDASPLQDHIRVICHVSHRDGHKEHPHVDMPADGKGAKGNDVMTKTHAMGAAMTYGQRYLLKLIFNIAVGDDDDGNSGPRNLSPEGVALMESVNAVEGDDFDTWASRNDAALKALPDKEYNVVVKAFNVRYDKHKAAKKAGK